MASRKRSISNDADVSALYKEWDEASCPICMDHPHNAVLLICSSHDKGCSSYICDTSYRHSNCLDRFKKMKEENADSLSATSLIPGSHHDSNNTSSGNLDSTTSSYVMDHTNHTLARNNSSASVDVPGGSGGSSTHGANPNFPEQEGNIWRTLATDVTGGSGGSSTHGANPNFPEQERNIWRTLDVGEGNMEKSEEGSNLRCPLCRGSVLGWKVVEETRKYLNLKSRSCSHESCSFFGNYRELRRHARRIHPTVRPADIDPSRQRDWHRLEGQREYNDIVSAIRSAMPGAVVVGDYVIDSGDRLSGQRDRNGGAGERGRWLSTLFLFQMIGSMDPGAELRGGRSRVLSRHRRATGTFSRRRYLWGENLLGVQDHDDDDDDDDEEEEEEENEELDLNIPSDLGDDGPGPPNPRRRRRLTRAQSDEDQQ